MSNLVTITFLLLALVAIAEATTYTTITTTTIASNSKGGIGIDGSCQKKIQRQQMSHCQIYLQSLPYMSLRSMVLVNQPTRGEQHFKQCCQQLRNIDEECRCQAIEKVIRQLGTEQMKEMMIQRAQELPQRCNMGPQECEIQPLVWF